MISGYVIDPPSEAIADQLNTKHALECPHGRDPCYMRCGVETGILGRKTVKVIHETNVTRVVPLTGAEALAAFRPWKAISSERRRRWAARAQK